MFLPVAVSIASAGSAACPEPVPLLHLSRFAQTFGSGRRTPAPAAVSSGATIYARQADGSMKTLREGTNGFWFMPNDPATPGEDPMCGDANSMEWAMAWIAKKDPPKGKVGVIYMLNGPGHGYTIDTLFGLCGFRC